MIAELFAIIAPILITTLVGFFWGKLGESYPADFVSKLVMNIGSPCLILGTLSKVHVDPAVMGQVALASFCCLFVIGLIGYFIFRLLRWDIPTFLPAVLLPNNGNMGLPLSLFAFGQLGLAYALGSFMVMMLITFTFGLWLVADSSQGGRHRMKTVLQQPVIYATLIAALLLGTESTLPKWLINTLDLLGAFSIPLMTIALGVSLAKLKITIWKKSIFVSCLRICGGFVVAWIICDLFDLESVERSVVILQSSMPLAVFNYMLAVRFNRDAEQVAAMVVVSTLVSFISLPFLLWVVLGF
jgi:malate permease and related proteins